MVLLLLLSTTLFSCDVTRTTISWKAKKKRCHSTTSTASCRDDRWCNVLFMFFFPILPHLCICRTIPDIICFTIHAVVTFGALPSMPCQHSFTPFPYIVDRREAGHRGTNRTWFTLWKSCGAGWNHTSMDREVGQGHRGSADPESGLPCGGFHLWEDR